MSFKQSVVKMSEGPLLVVELYADDVILDPEIRSVSPETRAPATEQQVQER